jgi:hypothetical protein
VTFPDPHNLPPALSKRPHDKFVSRYVARELWKPEFAPTFRSVREFATFVPVPETSIDKHGKFLPRKNKIGLAE